MNTNMSRNYKLYNGHFQKLILLIFVYCFKQSLARNYAEGRFSRELEMIKI